MKVKLINRMAGPDGNYPPGFVIELAESSAAEMIDGGYAVCAEEQAEEPIKETTKETKPKKAVK